MLVDDSLVFVLVDVHVLAVSQEWELGDCAQLSEAIDRRLD